jgi:hypothetical protein
MQPDQTSEAIPEPTFGTAPGIASVNSVYSYADDCGDDEADHKSLKGESLDGVMGWGDDDGEVG